MIVVVEGPSAAGKTSWITADRHGAVLIAEAQPGPVPRRGSDPAAAAAHWAKVNAARWAAACQAEQQAGIVVCDTDPFKLHGTSDRACSPGQSQKAAALSPRP
jgi:hypothetical protein